LNHIQAETKTSEARITALVVTIQVVAVAILMITRRKSLGTHAYVGLWHNTLGFDEALL
jgi:hypothetical protein